MTNHTEVLNYIIQTKGYKSFLEIGTQNGRNFNLIDCENKTGVDPDPEARATHHLDSDTFFESTGQTYDIIFIDGMHSAGQVRKDFINAMEHLNDGGVICIHDTNPYREEITIIPRVTKEWTGDVYKFICLLRADFCTLPFDYGITVIKKCDYQIRESEIDWDFFTAQRINYLNILTEQQFKDWL